FGRRAIWCPHRDMRPNLSRPETGHTFLPRGRRASLAGETLCVPPSPSATETTKMKNNNFAFAGIVLANLAALPAFAGEPTPLSAKLSNTVLELSWPATTQKTDGSVVRP